MKNILLCLFAMSLPLVAQQRTAMPPASTGKVDYEQDVKPLLEQNCYSCHGDTVQQSGLRLDLRQNALRGGDYGPVILPGRSSESKLIKRLVDGDGGMQMPPTGPLPAEDIGILRAWIDQGAEFRTTIVEAPPKPIDPRGAALVAAVRTQGVDAVAKLMASDPDAATARDAAGSTLLHHAAAFGSIETMQLLLDGGADANVTNRRRSTPLHWSLHDETKVRLVLSRGAAINARQVEGRTPLYIAASMGRAAPLVDLLLENGADPALATANGMTPLMAAAVRGDVDVMKRLVDRGADVNAKNGAGETALMFAAANGSPDAVTFLLTRGAEAKIKSKRGETALGNAGTSGVEETVRMLLDHGAEVNARTIRGYSPLMLAASSDTVPAGAVKRLLAAGADKTFVGDYDETAADFAAKRGDTEVARLLGASTRPAAMLVSAHTAFDAASIPGAVEKALALLEKQSGNFIRTAGCNSCHSQDLPSAAAGFAKSRGLRAPTEIPQLPQSMMPSPDRLIDLAVVSAPSTAWELVDFGMNNIPSSAYTDAAVRLVRMMQRPDGSWSTNQTRRPPMAAGEFQDAAVCIFAIKHYGRATDAAVNDTALAKAVAWLEAAKPPTMQDHAFRVIALAWADRLDSAKTAARALVELQRRDGGWSQFAGVETDAYATAQAVYALSAARVSQDDAAYLKGVAYLLKTQAPDGSWHVKTRSIWLQPYFETGFPYGRDQFISTAGTAWAAMALATVNVAHDATQPR